MKEINLFQGQWFIYALNRPGDSQVCYIGKTYDPEKRQRQHKYTWPHPVELHILLTFSWDQEREAAAAEMRLIREYYFAGHPLQNISGLEEIRSDAVVALIKAEMAEAERLKRASEEER